MKFYFGGCSFTKGVGLQNMKEERWSKLVCNHFDAEEHNFSESCGSNNRTLRKLLLDDNDIDYQIYFMQLTMPSRIEFFLDNEWRNIMTLTANIDIENKPDPPPGKEWKKKYLPAINAYYKKIYHKEYGNINEKIVYKSINAYLRDKPIIWTTIRSSHHHNSEEGVSSVPVDLCIGKNIYPRSPCGHPNAEGQRMIADAIISIINKRGLI